MSIRSERRGRAPCRGVQTPRRADSRRKKRIKKKKGQLSAEFCELTGFGSRLLTRWESGMVVPNAIQSKPTDFSSQVPRQCRTVLRKRVGGIDQEAPCGPPQDADRSRLGLPKLAMMSGLGAGAALGLLAVSDAARDGDRIPGPKGGTWARGRSMMPEPQSTRLWGRFLPNSPVSIGWLLGSGWLFGGAGRLVPDSPLNFSRVWEHRREPWVWVRARKLRIGASEKPQVNKVATLSPMPEVIWF